MDLISVIVPVYKAEKYLNRCVESIVNQTHKNLEILLVDDGSPDSSGQICDTWAEKDGRIQVIHQANAGSAMARNVALDIAHGTFIAFVDSDDYISENMLSHLSDLLRQGADIAECGYVEVRDDHASFDRPQAPSRTYTAPEAMAEHIQDRIFRQLIWNKLYRREVIGPIRFPKGKNIDDEFFTYQVLGRARNLIHSERLCYAYRQQESSVMHSMGAKKRLQAVEAKVQRHAYIRKAFPELESLSLKNLWFTCLYQGQLSLRENAGQSLPYLKSVLKTHPYRAGGCGRKEKLWLTAARISLSLTCRLRNVLKIGM